MNFYISNWQTVQAKENPKVGVTLRASEDDRGRIFIKPELFSYHGFRIYVKIAR